MIGKSNEEKLFPRGGVVKRRKADHQKGIIEKVRDDDLFSTRQSLDKSETKKSKRSKKLAKVVADEDPLAIKKVGILVPSFCYLII
jgi:hypothetical protein